MEFILTDNLHRIDDVGLRISGEDEFLTESDEGIQQIDPEHSRIIVDDEIETSEDNEISYEENRPLNPHARFVQYSKGKLIYVLKYF